MLAVEVILAFFVFLLIGIPSILLFLELILGQITLNPILCHCKRERCAILIPAHNEELLIGGTLRNLKKEISTLDHILVVADNCTDSTVDICKNYDVEVIQRSDKNNIGKGYALDFGIHHLQGRDYKTVVIVDADCEFKTGGLNRIIKHSQLCNKTVQAMYLMKASVNANSKTRVAEFAWLITNKVRAIGRTRLGMGTHLQGSGMAFPWRIFDKVSLASANLVEDLELGFKLLNIGEQLIFDDSAVILSYFPLSDEGIEIQRKRWEHGRLSESASLFSIMLKAVSHKRSDVFWMALDALIPPIILWMTIIFILGCISSFLSFFSISLPAVILFSCFILLFLAIVISWLVNARTLLNANDLWGGVEYILSKLSIYRSFFTSRQKNWVRTVRNDKHE